MRAARLFFALVFALILGAKAYFFFFRPQLPIAWIERPAGTFSLFSSVLGYSGKPYHALENGGFLPAVVIPPPGGKILGWLESSVGPPRKLGLVDQTDLQDALHSICISSVSAGGLIVLNIEWPLFVNPTAPAALLVNEAQAALNRANFEKVLEWASTEIHSSESVCVTKKVHFGTRGDFPLPGWWTIYQYATTPPTSPTYAEFQGTYRAWRAQNDEIAKLVVPNVDFIAPSLGAPYAADKDALLAPRSHVDFWTIGAKEMLSYAGSFPKPVIPFLRLRYFEDPESNAYGHFVDQAFFTTMLATVTAPGNHGAGIVYWDAARAIIDGSNVWRTNYPWYLATESFFRIKISR